MKLSTKPDAPKKKNKIKPKIGNGNEKRSAWVQKIKPNFDKIIELYSRGATKTQLCEMLAISFMTWLETEKKHPEFFAAITRARMNLCDDVRGAMYRAAIGYSTKRKSIRGVPFLNKKGEEELRKVQFVEEIEVPPNVPAQIAFLKNVGGWSDNPTVDNAVAESLTASTNTLAELQRKLGFFDATGKVAVRSSSKDIENLDIVSDEDLAAFGA